MSKLVRNMSDPGSVAFWRSVEASAASVRDAPEWMKVGIVLNPQNFETYPPVDELRRPESRRK